MYKTQPEDRYDIRGIYHPLVVGVYREGVAILLEGERRNWDTSMDWQDWDRLVAWVEWRRKELLLHPA